MTNASRSYSQIEHPLRRPAPFGNGIGVNGNLIGNDVADSREIFARNLKFWLKKRELTGVALAKKIGKKPPVVSQWLNQISGPDLKTLGDIADVLVIPVRDLFFDADEAKSVHRPPAEDEDEKALKHIAKRLGRKVRIEPLKNALK